MLIIFCGLPQNYANTNIVKFYLGSLIFQGNQNCVAPFIFPLRQPGRRSQSSLSVAGGRTRQGNTSRVQK